MLRLAGKYPQGPEAGQCDGPREVGRDQGFNVLANRKRRVSNWTWMMRLTRTAARTNSGSLLQEPPRTTRKLGSPCCSRADPSRASRPVSEYPVPPLYRLPFPIKTVQNHRPSFGPPTTLYMRAMGWPASSRSDQSSGGLYFPINPLEGGASSSAVHAANSAD